MDYKKLAKIPTYIGIYVILSHNIAYAESFVCEIKIESNGQLRNEGRNNPPRIEIVNGTYSFDFNNEKKVVAIRHIKGSNKYFHALENFSYGEFSYYDDEKSYSFCMEDKCSLERIVLEGKEVTRKIEKVTFFKNVNTLMKNSWFYVDFYNDPYNDSWTINNNTKGYCF
jgi:hypothetical protein